MKHFPPGTSKWNKIEHRLFCQISLAWRARPLTSYNVVINTIGAVKAGTGLTTRAVLDENPHPAGVKISDARMKDIEERCLTRGGWHPEWNYTLLAHPAGPEPEPPPASPSRPARRDTLNHPALTGARPAAVTAPAAALAVRFDARLEHDRRVRRGRATVRAPGAGSPRRLDATDYLLAALIRRHLRVPSHVTAALPGVHPGTVRHATQLITTLLDRAGIPLPPAAQPPPPHPLRTLQDLRGHAARHGITISTAPPAARTPPQATLTTRNTPRTHLILKQCPWRGFRHAVIRAAAAAGPAGLA